MTLSLKNIDSLKQAIKTIDIFCKLAGSKINLSKTECVLLGTLKNQYNNVEGIHVTNQSVKCLGIHIGHDKIECYNKNWMKIFHEMETLFESWKKRKLTIFGKCTIINTLAISKLIYVASILEIPDNDFIKNIKRLIFNFMWNKTDRIKRNTIIGEVYEGGIGLVDIESKFTALKAMWIPRLLSTELNSKHFFNSFCKSTKIDIKYLINTNETV